MSFQLMLPSIPISSETPGGTHCFENNAVIIIGANGSGKSRLGAWIETKCLEEVHRVSAQRSLTFSSDIEVCRLSQAESLLFTGTNNTPHWKYKMQERWHGKATTQLIDDYKHVLSLLLAKKNKQHDDFVKSCKENGVQHSEIPITVFDEVLEIWDSIFQHRTVNFENERVTTFLRKANGTKTQYSASDMSDGERVALYLIGQVICIPSNKTIVIDEPEIHLHRSIMNALWKALEQKRSDCLFVYITHDIQFAAAHQHAKKIWVKSYDGTDWDWAFVERSELPEECLLEILGNRKNVLFVEGEENSYDTQLYREVFKNYHVVPCGGCGKVIESVKAMKLNKQLHHLEAYGLIDRDFRSDNEISALKSHNIHTLNVAEVENLFCVEEVMEIMNQNQGFPDRRKIDDAIDFIINTKFKNQIEQQKAKAIVSEIKHRLTVYEIPERAAEAKAAIGVIPTILDYELIKVDATSRYDEALSSANLKKILLVFNSKEIAKDIGRYFGVNKYCETIIRLCKGGSRQNFIEALKPYLPREIPMELESCETAI